MHCFIAAGHGPRGDGTYDPGHVAGVMGEVLAEEHLLADRAARAMAYALKGARPSVVPRGSLGERIAYVNRWSEPGDIAVEIHMNSAANEAVHGAEVFYYYQPGNLKARALASLLHAGLVKIGRAPRGPKPDTQTAVGKLGWCRKTKPWAALVEVGFITNDDEREWLLRGGAEKAGQALARAVEQWT